VMGGDFEFEWFRSSDQLMKEAQGQKLNSLAKYTFRSSQTANASRNQSLLFPVNSLISLKHRNLTLTKVPCDRVL
jgi:hypothetical protein